jgi:DNA polymerase-3 subunit epsilon
VGKAKDIRKRVSSHFTGHNPKPQRQHFLRSIYSIHFERCGTELLALLLEAIEIKRLWPIYNRAMKRQEPKFALYCYEDLQGYLRLSIGKHKKGLDSVYLFNLEIDAVLRLRKLINEFALLPELCGFKTKGQVALPSLQPSETTEKLAPEEYNSRVNNALEHFTNSFSSFAILDKGRDEDEQSCIWIEKGGFYGFGYISHYSDFKTAGQVKELVTRYTGNDYMMQLVYSYAEQFPQKVLRF